ncbi:MAG: hypothetical protein A2Y60_01075 [Chloroflexi bacterium RBG_13_54_9]|nr:MAG: hypothetical protein A2Y60_01075 [Chloroflexi bacterium RBG_13_54_9]
MKILRLLLLLVFVFALTAIVAAPGWAQAQGEIAVLSSSYENRFPEELVFRLEAESSAKIEKITLFYAIKGERTSAYAYPDFAPDLRVKAEYALKSNTQKTYLPPGSEIGYYWLIEDVAGHRLQTKEAIFTYDDIRFTWKKATKDGVTLYWYSFQEAFIQALLDEAMAGLERLSAEAGLSYSNPMKIFVYDSKGDMDPALPPKSETYSQQTVTLGVRLTSQIMLLLGNHPEVKETVVHELSHMVIHQLLEGPFGDLPAWLDEGLAMYAEGKLPERYQSTLNSAIGRDELISVRSLSSYSGDPSQVTIFYAESWSVVKYLLDTYGREKMAELLNVFKEGSRYDDALQKVYGFDMDGLDAQWRLSLGLKPRPSPQPTAERRIVPTLVPFGAEPQTQPTVSPLTEPAPPSTRNEPKTASAVPLYWLIGGGALLVAMGIALVATLVLRRRT